MQITLPGGRKATVIGQVTDKMIKIRLEDGRETLWTTDKLPKQFEEEIGVSENCYTVGKDNLKVVVIPAIDRLEEFIKDTQRLHAVSDFRDVFKMTNEELKLFDELLTESEKEFINKWGLI